MKYIISIFTGVLLSILAGTAIAQENLPFTPPSYSNDLMMDNQTYIFLRADRLEYALVDGSNPLIWDIQGYIGKEYNKFWITTEGELLTSKKEGEMEFQALYSRAISPYFDVRIGARFDVAYSRTGAQTRSFAVIGIQGLAPYFWEINANVYVSRMGDVSAEFEAEYDFPITQRLFGQPSVATAIAIQDVPKWGVGSGFNYIELGFRLRYEIERELAPYIGISWHRKLGETADFARAEGEDVSVVGIVAGIRLWW